MNIRQIERKIEKLKSKIKVYEDDKDNLSKEGYWTLGYYKGQLSILEDWLDCMIESKNILESLKEVIK